MSARPYVARLLLPDGSPAPEADLKEAFLCDSQFDPYDPETCRPGKNGELRLVYPRSPFALCAPLNVSTVGRKTFYATAGASGYRSASALHQSLLNREIAQSHLARVGQTAKWAAKHIGADESLARGLNESRAFLDAARSSSASEQVARLADQSLALSVGLGEQLTETIARARISRVGLREAFLFGLAPGSDWDLTAQACNAVSVRCDWFGDGSEAEAALTECVARRLVCQIEDDPWPAATKQADTVASVAHTAQSALAATMRRFRGRTRYWQIAKGLYRFAGRYRISINDVIVIVAGLGAIARETDSHAVRIVSLPLTGASGSPGPMGEDGLTRGPLSTASALVDANAPFECLEVEVDNRYDLHTIEEMLERFAEFGKPIQVRASASVGAREFSLLLKIAYSKAYVMGCIWDRPETRAMAAARHQLHPD